MTWSRRSPRPRPLQPRSRPPRGAGRPIASSAARPAFNAALTAFWLFVIITRRDALFFQSYDIDRATVMGVTFGILVFYVLWGFIWYAVKTLLLREVAVSYQRGWKLIRTPP